MSEGAVRGLAARVWERLDAGVVKGGLVNSREIYQAIWQDLVRLPHYDPETDVRVKLLLEVLACQREERSYATVDAELRFVAGYAAGCVKMPVDNWQERTEQSREAIPS